MNPPGDVVATNNEFDRQSVNDAFADRLTSEIAAVPDNLDLPANAIPARPEAVQVAQAGTPAQPQTVVVELAEGNIARLPEGADISEPRQNGTDLEFVQPDGTVIVIPNGAVQGLTLFIGAVEIPPQAVAQLFTTNGIEAAAGPDAGPAQGSHGNFQDNVGGQGIGDGIGFSSLLGNTDLNFGTGDTQSEQGNLPPNLFGATYSASLAEDALLNGNPEGGEVRVITGVVAASDVDQLTYGFTAPAGEFTSHGVAIVWSIEPGTGDLVGMAGDTLIIRAHIERTADNNGAYTITLSGPIDHPAGAGENNVAMNLGIVVSDGFNTSETTLTLTIGDDMPISTEPTAGTVEEAGLVPGGYEGGEGAHSNVLNGDLHLAFGADGPAANAAVVLAADGATWQQTTSTTGILTGADDAWTLEVHADGTYTFTLLKPLDHSGEGNGEAINIGISVTATDFDGDSATSNFAVTVNDDVPFAGESTNGQLSETTNSGFSNAFVTQTLADQSLNIHWGADSANAGGSYDRAVTFATTTAPEGLTSNGFQVIYVVSEDGTTITAYRVTMGENPLTHEPEQHFVSTGGGDLGPNPSNSARVFSVQLSDTGNGTYTFTLYDNLDHPEGNGSVSLDFNFVAKDADGDTAGGQFQIGIEDTVPEVVGEAQIVTVSEAQLTDGQSGALNIDWNADDGAAKHINFAAEGLPQGLKSDGVDIVYQVQQDAAGNDVLVAYKEGGSPDNPVFMVAFTEGNPTYTFTLFQNLDHPAGSDTLELNFGIVATDGDGDTVTQDFTVNVADDKPVFTGPIATPTVDEDGLPLGNNGLPPSGQWPAGSGYSGSDAPGSNIQTGWVSLGIDWGSDDTDQNDSTILGVHRQDGVNLFDSSPNAGMGRAVYFADTAIGTLEAMNLTSRGETVTYDLVESGTRLIAHVGLRVVFTVVLSDDGQGGYNFTLTDELDHPVANSEDDIELKFDIVARDYDGDTAQTTFGVIVDDDAPVIGTPGMGTVEEEESAVAGNGNEDRGGVGDDDTSFLGFPINLTTEKTTRSLDIDWGADDNNSGSVANRSVGFLASLDGAVSDFTSNGQVVTYSLEDNGTKLVARGSDGHEVFNITLSDALNGSYTFTLVDTIDHNGAGEDAAILDFGFTATDADGDSVNGQFSVRVLDDTPLQGSAQNATVAEDDVSAYPATDTSNASPIVTKSLGIAWGADDDIRTGAGDTFGRSVHFVANGVNVAAATYASASDVGLGSDLYSGGVKLVYVVADNDDGGQTITATKGAGGEVIFTIELDPTATNGSYTFELKGELDHAANSNKLDLDFNFRGTDADGDNAPAGSFKVTVNDDKPVAGEATTGAVNEDDISSWPQTDGTPFSDAGKSTTQALNISWGADDDIRTGAGDTFGRSVGFSTNAGVVSAQTFTDAALVGLSVSGGTLTSNGVALVYQVVNTANGGQILTAYKGEVGGDVIFKVTLDPTSTSGSYKFDLVGELDHAANSDSATLTFGFRGADADGDSTGKSSFMVTIADDKPVIGSQHTGVVDEDGFPQLESGAGNPGPIFGGGDEFLAGTIDSHSLAISWGADDGSNRSVTFNTAAISAPADLTSNGIAVVYEYSAGNTMLTAYRFDGTNYIGADGEVLTAAGKAGAAVFTVGLSESGSGSYTFTLLDNIDQARGGEENNTVLNFGFTATDADGDAVSSSFNVSIDDDTPVVLINQPVAVDEGDIGSADAAQTGALGIFWGSDLGNSVVDGGNTGLDGDRAVVFGQNNAPSWLTSNGAHVRYEVGENGTLLTAYRFENGHYVGPNGEDLGTSPADAARVFTVTLSDTGSGSYTFTLLDNIDSHGASDSLGFNFTAIDGDGDGVNSSFVVVVLDDGPSLGGATNASVDEDGLNGNPGAPAPYAGSDLAGEATNTGAVSLGINWGADADLKSEALTPGGNIGTVDDPIGRTVEFVRASGSAQTLGVGVVNAAQLGAGFADLKSDGVGLDYRIDYMLDSQGHWNGGYVLTAYKDGTDASVEANQVFKLTLDPTATNGSYTFDLLGSLDHPVANQEDDLQLTFSFRAGDSDGDKTGRGSFTVTVDDDAPVIHEASAAVNLLTNGDFSNGSWPHAESWGAWATEATGWKITGTGTVQLERVEDNYLGMSSSTHGQMVDLGSTAGNITISQSIAGLATDKPYTLTFEIGSPDTASSKLEVYWNGHLVGTFVPTGTMTTMTIADLLPDAQGHGVISFKEVGTPDNTGTYLANVGLAPSDMVSAPVIYGTIGEDEGNATVVLTEGSSYSFGADGAGSVAFDKDATVITTPTGTTLAVPDLIYDAATGTLTVAPGWGFNGLSEGEIATLSIPFTVTDGDGDTTTGIYQLTVVGKNDAVTTSEAFPDGGTITEYDETNPAANSTDDRTVFDAEPGHAGYNGGAFYIYDDQGDSHTLSITSPSGALGYLTASVSEETVNDGVGLVTWHYHISDADLNPLQAGETRTEVFQVTVDDGHGSQTTRDITITLVGTNDTPVISVEQGDSDYVFLTETDAGQQANGTLSVADADVKDAVTATVLGVTASGSGIENLFTEAQLLEFFKVGTNPVIDGTHTAGDISWTFDSNGEAFNFLPKGWESVLSYTIQVDDGHGGTDTHVVQIKLHGTNDLPVVDLNGDAAGQDATVTAVEQLDQWIFSGAKISDADTGNLHSMTVAFATRPDGSAEVLSFNTAASTALAAAGLIVTATADGGFVISGDASVATYQTVLNGIIYNNGSDNPTSGGRELTVVVNDGMDDSVAHTTTVNVIPLNDKPVFAGTMHAEVAEGGTHTLTLAELGFSDPDDNAGGVAFKIVSATHGRVLLDGILSESFTAQAVIDGRVTFEHDGSEGNSAGFTVTVEDGNEDGSPAVQGEFTFSVDPVNDAPEATALTGSVGEDGPSYSQDLLASASDPDGDALSVQDVATSVTTSGLRTLLLGTDYTVTNGVFALTAAGFAKFNALNDGESDELTLTYKVSDGQAQTSNSLTVTIVGANEVVVTNPPTVDDTTSAAGRYAFVKDYMSPNAINFDLASLFGGGAGALTYTLEKVYTSNYDDWLNRNGDTVSGNPVDYLGSYWDDDGMYMYKVTATDASGHQVSTYVAFNAIEDSGRIYDLTDNGKGNDNGVGWANDHNGDGDLILIGDNINKTVKAGDGDDVVIGSSGGDDIRGGTGHDAVYAQGGNDYIDGDDGNDFLDGGNGNDTIYGGTGHDILLGGNGNDFLYGEDGNDILLGGAGNDKLDGGSGDDLLIGGAGSDTLTGGWGVDTFKFQPGDLTGGAVDYISDFQTGSNGDIIDLSELLSGASGNKADLVRFEYANGATELLSHSGSAPGVNGDVTLQVNVSGTWTDVATIHDTGSNLTNHDDIIRILLDSTVITHNI